MRHFVKYKNYWWEYKPEDSLREATLYNAVGGRMSFCDIRFCEVATADNFSKLDWSGTAVFDNEKYLSGWLSPKGEFWGCDYRHHDDLAYYVLGKQTYQLENEGYIKITYEETRNGAKKYYILMGQNTIPTNEQTRYLFNTFKDDRLSLDEMLWAIRVKKISYDRRTKAENERNKNNF